MLFYSYQEYLKNRYGDVLYRVPLDAGFSCPHRKKDKSGGCTFCPEDGARAVQLGSASSLSEQIKKGVNFAKRRYHAAAFMAYLQAFTATFSSREELRRLVFRITSEQKFAAIAFGTRPDCLPEKVVKWLAELQEAEALDIWVELGVQTANDSTLQIINRGHSWQKSEDAIKRLAEYGISTTAHLIIGLPGETRVDWLETIDKITALPISAIKLHNLHIIKGTEMASQWLNAPFPLLGEHDYIEELLAILERIPAHIPIVRLTTDTPENELLAPLWQMKKGQFLKALTRQMTARGISQGSALRKSSPEQITLQSAGCEVTTDDGSPTFFNEQVQEHYHSLAGARSEALKKYIEPANLKRRLQKGPVRLLDICFGLGYNSLVACESALETGSKLEIVALEMDKTVVQRAAQLAETFSPQLDWAKVLDELLENGFFQQENITIRVIWGDARNTINRVKAPFNLIWLDAFSTQKNSELWTVDFFRKLRQIIDPQGSLLTYCAAIPVRSGLIEAGFAVGETEPFGRDRGGTIAMLPESGRILQLPERDHFLIKTLRGVPYRDPAGVRTNKEILRAREAEILTRKEQEGKG